MVENKRSFRQKHPVVMGISILAGVFICTWIGMTFFLPLLSNSAPTIWRGCSVGMPHNKIMLQSLR